MVLGFLLLPVQLLLYYLGLFSGLFTGLSRTQPESLLHFFMLPDILPVDFLETKFEEVLVDLLSGDSGDSVYVVGLSCFLFLFNLKLKIEEGSMNQNRIRKHRAESKRLEEGSIQK